MRVVIDTNIFISAALKKSSIPEKVVRWVSLYGNLLKSEATQTELLQVLQRPHLAALIPVSFTQDMQDFFAKAELVIITQHIRYCRDPKDDKFLELAINGKADIIVSGDQDLLMLGACENIPIVKPADFLYLFVR